MSLDIPLLSRIEHAERVRTLPAARRTQYALLSAGALLLAFLLSVIVATAIALIASSIVFNTPINGDNIITITLPILTGFMVAIGFSSNPVPEMVGPNDTLRETVKKAARSGLRGGLIIGFVFGLIWSLILRTSALYINWNTMFTADFHVEGILYFAVLMALIISPVYAAFRAFNSAAGHLILHYLSHTS